LDEFKKRYDKARDLAATMDGGAYDAALSLANDFPDNAHAICLLGELHLKAEQYGVARVLYERADALLQKSATILNNLGMCWEGTGNNEKARTLYMKAHRIAPDKSGYMANIANTLLNESKWKDGLEWSSKAIKSDPENSSAQSNYGIANLALGNWEEGWRGFEHQLGRKYRKIIQYQDEPRWQGEKEKTVVVYGEQGLGDEVMYASCLEDASKDAKLILECDPRLEGLFKRSFPFADVYGTRRIEPVAWPNKYKIDASCGIAHLPKIYRNTKESFPRKPYLVADPDRRAMFKGWLDSMGKRPKIGITWTGGGKHPLASHRKVGLPAFWPLFDEVDAEWISLSHKAEDLSGTPVRSSKWIEKNQDYDDAAALIAELDLVVGIHGSAHHLAGALGKPTLTFVPHRHIWLYGQESFPWYDLTLFRQRQNEPWIETIRRASPCLSRFFT
jgi:hypothetical protein